MGRHQALKQLDLRSRNQLRNILTAGGSDAIARISALRSRLKKDQVVALEAILTDPAKLKGVAPVIPFPKGPQFKDALNAFPPQRLDSLLANIENTVERHLARLNRQFDSLHEIDAFFSEEVGSAISPILEHIQLYGWSHAILRRIVLVREFLAVEDERIEKLLWFAGLEKNSIVVTSLIHAYAKEQNYLSIKRSTLNVADRGVVNRYSRNISRLPFQPFARDQDDLAIFLGEVFKCSLVDGVILARFNSHLFNTSQYPTLQKIIERLNGDRGFERLLRQYPTDDSDCEHNFFQQSSAWLEYEAVRSYRVLADHFYDASRDDIETLPPDLDLFLQDWIGEKSPHNLVDDSRITNHGYMALAQLEQAGTVTRSAIFNYWLFTTDGQIGFERSDLVTLMSKTRDLARTTPIEATRNAVRLSRDTFVRFILLLLLARRSQNQRDSFQLRRIMEGITIKEHGGKLVDLIRSVEHEHPVVAEYIYDITTEDFLARCTTLCPHLSDIPETRVALHNWMADRTGSAFYRDRARAVHIDHQLNKIRNEIDDNRIYVDPARFSSWINDEVMADFNGALTTTGANKKVAAITCDEVLLSASVQYSYSAFCSNGIFGIASYIGRRIRHGTFRGHLYSSVVNHLESQDKFSDMLKDFVVSHRWARWKERYSEAINQIINERLHLQSKQKPHGLLQPDTYGPAKLDILSAAVRAISTSYTETKSTDTLDRIVTEYCWRLAEIDLHLVITYLKSQKAALKMNKELDDLVASAGEPRRKIASEFKREVIYTIDKKLGSMYSWFNRPSNVSPRASLALLYDAVVDEAKDTVPSFDPKTQSIDLEDIELEGGAYHVIYDALYVVLVNAAKYGDPTKSVKRSFSIRKSKSGKQLVVEITSCISTNSKPEDVAEIIARQKNVNHEDATTYERRSGIPKLMQLAYAYKQFEIELLDVVGTEVVVRFSYGLDY